MGSLYTFVFNVASSFNTTHISRNVSSPLLTGLSHCEIEVTIQQIYVICKFFYISLCYDDKCIAPIYTQRCINYAISPVLDFYITWPSSTNDAPKNFREPDKIKEPLKARHTLLVTPMDSIPLGALHIYRPHTSAMYLVGVMLFQCQFFKVFHVQIYYNRRNRAFHCCSLCLLVELSSIH